MADQRFPAEHRLRRGEDFDRVFGRKCSASDDLLVVYGLANDLGHPRLGLAVSRKVGNAVRRNRWKRLLREAFRLSRGELPAGLDLVVLPRPQAQPTLEGAARSLLRLARRVAARLERERK